ncbi:MAG TPA: acetate--CoA ligase family protein [Acidimicrobiales bacterium]|nr:acetate--CoA ligase family protein [Acidimicrobiales bacterium]
MPTLSEADSKKLLAAQGIPVPHEEVASDPDGAAAAAARIGFPVVAKLCGEGIAHKTERGLVRLALADEAAVRHAAAALLGAATPEDGPVGVLVAPMVSGIRELIAGLVRDPQFGPCVMVGVGGVLAEAVADVAFRVAPITRVEAEEMIDDLAAQALLGPLRGEPAVDRERLIDVLAGLSALAGDPSVVSVDLNPLIVSGGVPVAVDALVEVSDNGAGGGSGGAR